jgi:hypothetical protein
LGRPFFGRSKKTPLAIYVIYLVLGDLEVAIPNPLSYVNASTDPAIDPNTLFVRVETLFGCTRISELKLVVSTTTIPSTYKTSSSPYEECYDKSDDHPQFELIL